MNSSRYEQIHTILMSHDYLRFCLTEKLYCEETNISESNFYNVRREKYDIQLKVIRITECIDKLPTNLLNQIKLQDGKLTW